MDYLIKVRSLNSVDGDEIKEEIITHADLAGHKDDYILTYTEDVDGGIAETVIRVIKGECVTVRRKAEMQTDMVIETGRKHTSEHRLPFGSFQLEVIGSRVSSVFSEDEVQLSFAYTTYQGNEPIGKAEFNITLRKKGRISGKI